MEVLIVEDIEAEPVTLAEIKNFCRIDLDYSGDDTTLSLICASAREKLEGFLNVYFGVKSIEVQFTGYELKLPYGPNGDIESVKQGETVIPDTDYTLKGLAFKTIQMTSDEAISWFYPTNGGPPETNSYTNLGALKTYNIVYETGYETLPAALKHALLIQIDYDFKNQGMPNSAALSPIALQKAKTYSQNLVL